MSGEHERPPLFGRWGAWYALVVAELVAIIVLCGVLAGMNG